jgi:hypothetical protein
MSLNLTQAAFYRELGSPSYCSAPQTWQTMPTIFKRDRQRRHILNLLCQHRNEDASAVKTRINDVLELGGTKETLACCTTSSANPASHEYPCYTIAAFSTVSVDSLQPNVASRFPQNDSHVTVTARTTSGEVFSHESA